MKHRYQEEQLRSIAKKCREFEHVINAMGYGYSLLNVSPDNYIRRCSDCVHWASGSCGIFADEIKQWE